MVVLEGKATPQPADLAESCRTAGRDRSAGGPLPRRFSAKRKLQAIADSRFTGEDCRKIRARLRFSGIRRSPGRVPRLMRENGLLAPHRVRKGTDKASAGTSVPGVRARQGRGTRHQAVHLGDCSRCARLTSMTAGTVLHGSRLVLNPGPPI